MWHEGLIDIRKSYNVAFVCRLVNNIDLHIVGVPDWDLHNKYLKIVTSHLNQINRVLFELMIWNSVWFSHFDKFIWKRREKVCIWWRVKWAQRLKQKYPLIFCRNMNHPMTCQPMKMQSKCRLTTSKVPAMRI